MEYKPETKQCQNCKKEFTIESDDFSFYEKIKVPPPTFCPICRAERRFCFRNERRLMKVKDAFSGDLIFSLYPEGTGRKIITQEEWHGDSWDAVEYAKDYDFSKNFFEQLRELELNVPVASLRVQHMVDSPYCANATGVKSCYLCFNSSYAENSMYSNGLDFSKDCMDCSNINHSERCYQGFWLQNCYQCYFTITSVESSNLWFSRDCLGCSDCFGCADLRKASYCIFNKKYTKDDYFKKLSEMKIDTNEGLIKANIKAREFWNTQPVKFNQGIKNVDSTGSYVTNCKNVHNSFLMKEGENVKYSQYLQVPKSKDCYDCTAWGANMELDYEVALGGDNSYELKFSYNCWPSCKNIEYSINLFSCSDCFGCVGLKKKQYCILNRQYTKDEYFEMVEKIKQHTNDMPYVDKKGNVYKYGEFFPVEFSPFGYNHSAAMQFFDITKEKAEAQGYPWYEISKGQYIITKKKDDLPLNISKTTDDILNEIIECEKCKSAYKILKDELLFYRRENLPIPTMCHECRFEIRIKDRLKLELYERKCMCGGASDVNGKYRNTSKHIHGDDPCEEVFKTGYSPDRSEIIYCEKCYQQEVY
jgi:hypothetical protein